MEGGVISQLSALFLEDGTNYYGLGLNGRVTVMISDTSTGGNGSLASTNAISYDSVYMQVSPIPNSSMSYLAKKSIKGTFSDNAGNSTLITANYIPAYDIPASLSALAGSYSGNTASATGRVPTTFVIAQDGSVSGSIVGVGGANCPFVGTAVPRASGKNIFNLSVTFGQGCLDAGKTVTGVTTTVFSVGSVVTLQSVVSASDRSNLFYTVASKQ